MNSFDEKVLDLAAKKLYMHCKTKGGWRAFRNFEELQKHNKYRAEHLANIVAIARQEMLEKINKRIEYLKSKEVGKLGVALVTATDKKNYTLTLKTSLWELESLRSFLQEKEKGAGK